MAIREPPARAVIRGPLAGSRPGAGPVPGAQVPGHPVPGNGRRPQVGARLAAAVVGLAAVGVALRVWVLLSPIGSFDADSAVPGLMARHILEGELPAFYWGQPYGGSIEAFLAAALFAVLPDWTLLVKLVPMLLCAAVTVLCWLVGRRVVGARPAAVGAALLWVLPFTVWYSTKIGPYWGSLAATLTSVLLLLRLAAQARPRWWEAALAGVSLGVAWWSNPSVLMVVPFVLLFLAPDLARHWRLSWVALLGFALGAGPWLAYNIDRGFPSLRIGEGQMPSTYGERLSGFFTTALPTALGLRRVFTHEWLLGAVGPVLYAAVLGAFAVFVLRAVGGRGPAREWVAGGGRRGVLLLSAVVLAYPFLYALSPFTWYLGQPRYLLFLLPFAALAAGRALAGTGRAWVVLAAAGAIAVAGIVGFPRQQPFASHAEVPADSAPVHRILARQGITRAYADYWIAYRLTFESRERRIVAPVTLWRYPAYQAAVAAVPRPAYVFPSDSPVLGGFVAAAAARSVPVEVHRAGGWAVVVPAVRVLPGDWPEVFGCPARCGPAWPD